jgi:hypothetical protein
MFALFINASILILATRLSLVGTSDVAGFRRLQIVEPDAGVGIASTSLPSPCWPRENSTLTGTLAGQIVMEGF